MRQRRMTGADAMQRQRVDRIAVPWPVAAADGTSLRKLGLAALKRLRKMTEALSKALATMLRALLLLFVRGSSVAARFARDHVLPAVGNAAFAPLTLAARSLSMVGNALRRAPAAAAEPTVGEQAARAGQHAAEAQRAETQRAVTATDTAALLRRVATRRARGIEIPEALLARLPAPLRRYVEALDENALKALAQASVDDIAAWLSRKSDRIPGVPTPDEVAAAQSRKVPVRNTLGDRFAQRVRDKLRERNHGIIAQDSDVPEPVCRGMGR